MTASSVEILTWEDKGRYCDERDGPSFYICRGQYLKWLGKLSRWKTKQKFRGSVGVKRKGRQGAGSFLISSDALGSVDHL